MYVITREGIYRHEILFMTENSAKAITKLHELDKKEPDNYHSLALYQADVDEEMEDVVHIMTINTRE